LSRGKERSAVDRVVHPLLIEMAKTGAKPVGLRLPRATKYLSRAERGLLSLLEEWDAKVLKPSKAA